MLIQCRAPTPKLSADREPHAKVGKFQSPVLGRMRPAMTEPNTSLSDGAGHTFLYGQPAWHSSRESELGAAVTPCTRRSRSASSGMVMSGFASTQPVSAALNGPGG